MAQAAGVGNNNNGAAPPPSGNPLSRFDASQDSRGGGCRPLIGLFPDEAYQPTLPAPDVFRDICSRGLGYSKNVLDLLMDMVSYHVDNVAAVPSPLTRDERFALAWYTSDVRDLSQPIERNWWFVVNSLLRERNMDALQVHKDGIYYLQSALQKLWAAPSPSTPAAHVTLWRGLKGVRLKQISKTYFEGATACWPGFSSASLNQSTMMDFSEGQGGTLMKLSCPLESVADISSFSMLPREAECLLSINTIIKVQCAVASDLIRGFPGAEGIPMGVDLVVAEVVATPAFGRFHVNSSTSTSDSMDGPQSALCYIEALKHNPKLPQAWNCLGAAMSATEQVQVNGASYTQRQCYVEALKHDPKFHFAWYNLGTGMSATEQVRVNGASYTERECYVEALKHDPKYHFAWNNLGLSMSATEQVQVNGTSNTQRQCYVEALKHDPKYHYAWNNLGCAMSATEQVQVNGASYTERQCYVEALKHDPKYHPAWTNLGLTMSATEQVQVNGTSYTQRQCYVEALKHDPKFHSAWNNLGASMSATEQVQVNGASYTQEQCFARQ